MTRRRTCATDRERQQVVDEFQSYGFRVVHDGPDRTLLRRRDHGTAVWHLFVFLLVGWWTLGLGNIVYALYRRWRSAEKLAVVVGE